MQVDPIKAGFSQAKLARIDRHLIENYIAPGKIAGCQVMVARRGTAAYFKSFGDMDRERARPVQEDTIFRIYSMTKPITSIALMTLYEEGRFQLNDPVHRFLPAWRDHEVWVRGEGADMVTRPPASPMTMRHVLSHTSGLTYGALLDADPHPVNGVYQELGVRRSDGETMTSFAEKLSRVPLRFDPGTQWLYSLATDVCGCLVEVISGQKFEDFLHQRIFEPLGMTDTAFWVPESKINRFAANYQRAADKSLQLIDDPLTSSYLTAPSFPSGGGGLVSTTTDYAKFCDMLRLRGNANGVEIIGSRTLALMTKNHILNNADLRQTAIGSFSETAYEGVGFGLGFATTLDEISSGTIGAGDYYWGGAASTIFWVDPVEDLYAVFMTQLMPSATFNFRGQLKNIIYGAISD